MMKSGFAVMLGGLLAAAPLQAQSPEAGHQHGQRAGSAAHAEGHHCPMHAAKHGAKADADGSHAGHGSHAGGGMMAGHGGTMAAHGGAGAPHGMMAAHTTAPMMLLKHREMLQLTPAQVEQLEAMQAAHRADCERRMAAAKAADAAAAAALAAPDLTAYEARLREAAGHRVDCKVDMARLGEAGAALLTDAQRAHLPHLQHASH